MSTTGRIHATAGGVPAAGGVAPNRTPNGGQGHQSGYCNGGSKGCARERRRRRARPPHGGRARADVSVPRSAGAISRWDLGQS